MPCLKTSIEAAYTSQDVNGGLVPDRAVLDLGRVTNVGPWGWEDASVNNSNEITFHILVKATNHSAATVASQHAVTIGFIQNGVKLDLGNQMMTVEAAPAIGLEIVVCSDYHRQFKCVLVLNTFYRRVGFRHGEASWAAFSSGAVEAHPILWRHPGCGCPWQS